MTIRLHGPGVLAEVHREDSDEEEAVAAVLDELIHNQFGISPHWERDPEQ